MAYRIKKRIANKYFYLREHSFGVLDWTQEPWLYASINIPDDEMLTVLAHVLSFDPKKIIVEKV